MKAVLCSGVKGGVGKTTVAVELARRLVVPFRMQHGEALWTAATVAFLDADIDNPSAARALGLPEDARVAFGKDASYIPFEQDGIAVFSQALVGGRKIRAILWEGERHRNLIADAVRHTAWPATSRLMVVDLPAGSGDELIAAVQSLGARDCALLLVTIPRHLDAAERTVHLAKELGVPVLGVIENLAGFSCSHGEIAFPFGPPRARAFCENYGIPWLGLLPVDVTISEANEAGRPIPDALAVPVTRAAEEVLAWV